MNEQVGLNLKDSSTPLWSQTINREMKREGDISKVNWEQQKFYDREVKKIENILNNFQTAKEKVKNYLESKNKKESSLSTTSLTLEERKALLSVFEGFYNLDQKKEFLSSQLQLVGGENLETISPNLDKEAKRNVKRSLNKINWQQRELKVMKDETILKNKNNLYGWKTWEKSPFRIFYNTQEDWLKDMKNYEESLTTQQKKATQDRQRCGFAVIGIGTKRNHHSNICQANVQEYRKVAQKGKDVIEMHIAEWLLKKMGQLPLEQEGQK